MTPEHELQLGIAKIRYAAEVEAAKAKATGEVRVAELRYAEPARQETRRTMLNVWMTLGLMTVAGISVKVVPEASRMHLLTGAIIAFGVLQIGMTVREIIWRR